MAPLRTPVALGGLLLLSGALSLSHAAGPGDTAQLAQRLRGGGFVLVMRHAQSPDQPPAAQSAEPDNVHHERQLSEAGKASARALGAALRTLDIPIGPIYSSPTYRALQTLRLAGLGPADPVEELTEGPRGMLGRAGHSEVLWLQNAVTRPPPSGSNTLIVTHTPNIVGAFGAAATGIQPGEMLVFRPPARLLGRLTVVQWQRLASSDALLPRRSR